MNSLNISLFCAASVLLFLAVLAISLRCIVRVGIIKAFGIDDCLMVAATLFYVLAEVLVLDVARTTQGKDVLEILEVLNRAMKSTYFGELFYILTVWTLKLSIGAFLLRLVQRRVQRWVIFFVLGTVSLWSAVYFFMAVFQCAPVDHFWHPLDKGKCLPGRVVTGTSYAHSVVIGGSDLIFATLPIFVVWNLQMNFWMKLSVAGLLGLGAIAGITSFIRMPYVKALGDASVEDFFTVTSHLAIWTCIEPGVGIFVGSLATLRPLFRKFLGGSSIFSGSHYDGRNDNRYWPSSPQTPSAFQLDTFRAGNKLCLTTTVVEGRSLDKAGKSILDRSDSEEELYRKQSTTGIQKTVEFDAVSSTAFDIEPTSSRVIQLGEEDFPLRRGLYFTRQGLRSETINLCQL